MANNYSQSSSFMSIPEQSLKQAEEITERVINELETTGERLIGFEYEFNETGLWIYGDEFFYAENAEILVKTLIEELQIPGIHVISCAYTCSKLRINEFGGEAFAAQLGYPTVWINAPMEAERQALELQGEGKL